MKTLANRVSIRMGGLTPSTTTLLVTSIALGACALGLSGCEASTPAPKTATNYTENAKKAYDAAMEEVTARNWPEAVARLQEVKRKFGYSKYARLAELRLADVDFEQEKYAEAVRAFKQFVHDHRSDAEEVSYARSKIAEAQFREIGDSALYASTDERDQAATLDAYKELRSFLHDYPDGKESAHMRDLLVEVTARLIRHELTVAEFYLRRDKLEPAVGRILYALKTYASGEDDPSGRSLEPECLVRLGETYLQMHNWKEARDAFTMLLDRYPSSGLTVQARKFLAHMKERGV